MIKPDFIIDLRANQNLCTMKTFILLLFLALQLNIMAQLPVLGEYYFNRHEMVVGFNFSADGKFQFFYSYGAVDRNATGTFSIEGEMLKLKSDKTAGHDFTITSQSKQGKGYTLKFEHSNKYLLRDIRCIFFVNGNMKEVFTDENGKMSTDLNQCDSILVQHSLFADVPTLVKDIRNTNNRFTLSLNPSLEQVSFKGIDFKIVDSNIITCLTNYFMDIPDIEFKQK